MAYTTDLLLTEIKQRAAIPTSQETYLDSDLLRLATNELYIHIVPTLIRAREEYLIREKEYAVTDSTEYVTMPDRAVGGIARDVFFTDGNGFIHSVRLLDPEQRGMSNSYLYQDLKCYFKWDQLVFEGMLKAGTITIPYYCRPGALVELIEGGRITAIDTLTGELTLNVVPTAFTTSVNYDLISSKGTYPYHEIDLTASAVGASSITLSTPLPSDLAVGDYVCKAGESVLPQVPREFQPILAQRVVAKVLESQGDFAGLDRAKADLKEMMETAAGIIQPRLQGEPKKIVTGMGYRRSFY